MLDVTGANYPKSWGRFTRGMSFGFSAIPTLVVLFWLHYATNYVGVDLFFGAASGRMGTLHNQIGNKGLCVDIRRRLDGKGLRIYSRNQTAAGRIPAGHKFRGGCAVALHLQRKFGRLVHSPFDWTLTPFFSLIQVLEDDGLHLGETFFPHKEGIACVHYGLIYYHEFPRISGEICAFNSAAIAACRSKLTHKMSKMIEACSGEYRTLFIRLGKYGDGNDGNPVVLTKSAAPRKVKVSALNDLVGLLGRKFRNLDFHVVYLDHVGTGTLAKEEMDATPVSRLSIVHMPNLDAAFNGENTPGKFPQWDEFFASINLTASSSNSRLDSDKRY